VLTVFWSLFIVWTVFGVCILKPKDFEHEDLDFESLREDEAIAIIKERLWSLSKFILAGPAFWTIMLASAISILMLRFTRSGE
jgi:hypothetical protein